MIPHFIVIVFINKLYFFIFLNAHIIITNPVSKAFTKEID